MKILSLAAVIGLLLSVAAAPAQNKKPDPTDIFKDKSPEKSKQPDPMTGKKPKPGAKSASAPVLGKTIDQWIALISSKDPSKSEIAIQTILQFSPEVGQKAVPVLIKMLDKAFLLDKSVRVNAVIVLGTLLIEDNNPNEKEVQDAVQVLTAMLKNEKEIIVRYKTVEALAAIGPRSAPAIGLLISALQKEVQCWELREGAAIALGRIGYDQKNGPPVKVLHALFGAMSADPAAQVRLAAMQSLAFLGSPKDQFVAKKLYDALTKTSKEDPETAVRIWASMSLMSIMGKADPKAIKMIANYHQDKDVVVRVQVMQALAALGLDAKDEMYAIVAGLNDEEKIVQNWALTALSRMEKYAEPARSRLKEIVADNDWPLYMKELAQHTLDVIDGKIPSNNVSKDGKDKPAPKGP
jgi:HEAT repeat protein